MSWPGRVARAARSTCSAIGRPATGCNTLGSLERIREPRPAVRMTTAKSPKGAGGSEESVVWLELKVVHHSTRPRRSLRDLKHFRRWDGLADQDSNLE